MGKGDIRISKGQTVVPQRCSLCCTRLNVTRKNTVVTRTSSPELMNLQVLRGYITYRVIIALKDEDDGFKKGLKNCFYLIGYNIDFTIRRIFIEMASEQCLISSSIGKTIIGYFG